MTAERPAPEADWRETVLARRQPGADGSEEKRSPGGRFALFAFLVLVACQTTRWGWWIDIGGHTHDVGYLGQSVAGLAGSLTAISLFFVIRSPSGSSSGYRVVQLLPLLLGAACLLIVVGGFQQAYGEMASHRAELRQADLDAGSWLALLGGFSAAIGSLRATMSRLGNPLHSDVVLPRAQRLDDAPDAVPLERLRDHRPTR
jgi:uncharacterized membrane protein YeaQ/YmgE (transglycosylase-associated protein family)